MVLTLARRARRPLRERNTMLTAAGYATVYRETSLDDARMAEMRWALELLLRQNEPFFAVAIDRRWDVVMCNAPYARPGGDGGGRDSPGAVPRVAGAPDQRDEAPLRAVQAVPRELGEVASAVMGRALRDAATDRDPARKRILEECLGEARRTGAPRRPKLPLLWW